MSEVWRPLFELYWKNRPGAPFGHNPQRVFEAGFVAGMAERVNCPEIQDSSTTNSELIVEGERWLKYLHADNDIATTFIADAVQELKRCRCAITSEADTT
jgi:hypothetical protein